MKKFSFPLEPVLKLRRIQEDVAARNYAAVRSKRQHEERLLSNLRQLWKETAARLRATAVHGPIDQLSSIGARLEQIRQHIEACEQRLEALLRLEESKRVELIEAARQRGIVERLRERQEALFKLEQRRQVDRATDELTVLRHGRK